MARPVDAERLGRATTNRAARRSMAPGVATVVARRRSSLQSPPPESRRRSTPRASMRPAHGPTPFLRTCSNPLASAGPMPEPAAAAWRERGRGRARAASEAGPSGPEPAWAAVEPWAPGPAPAGGVGSAPGGVAGAPFGRPRRQGWRLPGGARPGEHLTSRASLYRKYVYHLSPAPKPVRVGRNPDQWTGWRCIEVYAGRLMSLELLVHDSDPAAERRAAERRSSERRASAATGTLSSPRSCSCSSSGPRGSPRARRRRARAGR